MVVDGHEVNTILIGLAALTPFGILLWRLFVVAAATKTNADKIRSLEQEIASQEAHDSEKFKDLYSRTDDHKLVQARFAETVKTIQEITLPRIEQSLAAMDVKLERKFDTLMDKLEQWRSGK